MACSAMAGSGKDFAEGRMRGKLRRIKNESKGRTSPRRKQKNLRIPVHPILSGNRMRLAFHNVKSSTVLKYL